MPTDDTTNDADGFEDPLENYEPKPYEDAIEQALAEETVLALASTALTTVSPDLTVEEGIQLLLQPEVPCLIVVNDEEKLLGVFSRRDVLDRVAHDHASAAGRPVREFMTTEPVSVFHDDPAAAAVCVMAVSGYRHAPIVDPSGTVLGMASPRGVLDLVTKIVSS